MMSEFQDDPTVNKSETVVLLGQVWMYRKREKDLEEKEGRMNLGGRENRELT